MESCYHYYKAGHMRSGLYQTAYGTKYCDMTNPDTGKCNDFQHILQATPYCHHGQSDHQD